ncbi:PREDICTED: protein aurora borealis [Vollenhovia emeryi]|uniref:protein aurora borealis n=1 Tax=Vollenhovia emeryi TaxID=411798 RepID=UPI0005F50FC9|nr:PREDICTED: protein aurora borealis [Vollenhovia emeryi]
MERVKWGTPKEKRQGGSPLACSSWMRETPVKRNDAHLKRLAQCLPFGVLPSHSTPPSKLRKFKNPFEPDLINSLHLSTISPTMFTKAPSPMQQSPDFTWSIDELARMRPARIEDSPLQQTHSPDVELETRAQAAIDRFFRQNQIIPSPWDVREKRIKSFLSQNTPDRFLNDTKSTPELSKPIKDGWSQTVLSLPQNLPSNVEEVLRPFFTFTQEQNVDLNSSNKVTECEDVNSSNNSLRRKLFFCHDEGTDTESESLKSLSPVQMSKSMTLACSPPQSGMFVHGTPLKKQQMIRQSNGSSVMIYEDLSPPNMSPIRETDRLYERIERCSPATRLNFAINTSTDGIAERKDKNSIDSYCSLDMSNSENDVKRTEGCGKLIIVNNDITNARSSINVEELPKCINSTDNIAHSNTVVFNDVVRNNKISLKDPPETVNFSRESHKQSNITSGTFEQQSISNSLQDTGYQTCSINSTIHTIDSCNISTSHKTLWNEKIVISKDNAPLS